MLHEDRDWVCFSELRVSVFCLLAVIQSVRKSVGSTSCKGCIESLVPASYWLRKYKWKKDFAYDVMSGLTVAIMHIPQGMAYALLGNMTPVVGIYMAFFPVLIYVFLGTSRHVSMGEFFSVLRLVKREKFCEIQKPSWQE